MAKDSSGTVGLETVNFREINGLGTETLEEVGLYEQDYQLWLEITLENLRSRNFSRVDLEHVLEELVGLGKSERRAIASYLRRLCEHLLKIKHWDTERSNCLRGWDVEVTNFRLQIAGILSDSPSLKNYLHEIFAIEYGNGRNLFLKGSGLDPSLVAEQPNFSLEQALDSDWLPGPATETLE
jgi:hypothetical protein